MIKREFGGDEKKLENEKTRNGFRSPETGMMVKE